jgi:hypothetical protein
MHLDRDSRGPDNFQGRFFGFFDRFAIDFARDDRLCSLPADK